ncbi:glycerol-3-phosphate dehydrogenase/oxidase [Fibrivirga algicola]|uniref:FAD-dependent oxidoreductase n=1 Tax=Fibrivirga algicola TaxID=2950420 RepID=A0ABX0QM08_9BACT|nr:FAD-dependent oxidoreductase [Fibrivirga algicola]NID11912.1 FAD-dependent oxidoreductase [Fibrivirga algicola]
MNRSANLSRLQTEAFDICIIGAGASGAGCAVDAASRGLRVALLEADDFGAGTSGTSTKLVHGGVRYLEQAVKTFDPKQLSLVRKALHERRTLLHIAPHLCHPLALLTPVNNLIEGAYYAIGLKIYDLLAGSRRMAPSRWLGKASAVRHFPAFDPDKLHSAVMYYDGQFDDIRLNLSMVQTAAAKGAAVANHILVDKLNTDNAGKITSVSVVDKLTGASFSVQARVFINATGTRADTMRQGANPKQGVRMRASKGAHVVLAGTALPVASGQTEPAALLVPKTKDGRVLFAIPWRGQWLIGTTDTEANPGDVPALLPDEATYLLDHVNQYVKAPIPIDALTGGFAGLRPLLQADPNASSQALVRDHEVEIDPVSGLVSIMGGKWTTYRLMAQETVDACCQLLAAEGSVAPGMLAACQTETLLLQGAEGYNRAYRKHLSDSYPEYPTDVLDHLANTYGTDALNVLRLLREEPDWVTRLANDHPFIQAEVIYAARTEMAQTLSDVLMRRIRLGLIDWKATLEALPVTARLLAVERSWTPEQEEQAMATFRAHIEGLLQKATGTVEFRV